MAVTVEFYGIPRKRAGRESVRVEGETLSAVLKGVTRQIPALLDCCDDGTLKPAYVANLNGRSFISDGATAIQDGDTVLLMSADAGG